MTYGSVISQQIGTFSDRMTKLLTGRWCAVYDVTNVSHDVARKIPTTFER